MYLGLPKEAKDLKEYDQIPKNEIANCSNIWYISIIDKKLEFVKIVKLSRKFTFRTSRRVAETPGFVGIMSLDPKTADKFGELDILSSFCDFPEDWLADGLCDEEFPELDCSKADKLVVDCMLTFDAFFARDLKAAANDEACGVWLVSVNFKDETLLFIGAAVVDKGIGVSQFLEGMDSWLLIVGIFNAEDGDDFIRDGSGAIDDIFVCCFEEGMPDVRPRIDIANII